MTTLYITHEAGLGHDTSPGHPERADRLRAVWKTLEAEEFGALLREEAPRGAVEDILRMHPQRYVDAIEAAVPAEGYAMLDADTIVSPGSWEAALRGSGGVCAAVDAVLGGRAVNAFCALRPPGHHAESNRAMGFCLFNNVAIAAARARDVHGLHRVAVLDFDVHHGNGTQHMFEEDGAFFYGSSHEYPLFPGTGRESETGIGNIVNVELRPSGGSEQFRAAWEGRILPAMARFRPELVIVSAGFDGHARDPLASQRLSTADFSWITERIAKAAAELCGGRLVSSLEGGYDLDALADSVAAHVRGVRGWREVAPRLSPPRRSR